MFEGPQGISLAGAVVKYKIQLAGPSGQASLAWLMFEGPQGMLLADTVDILVRSMFQHTWLGELVGNLYDNFFYSEENTHLLPLLTGNTSTRTQK